MQKEFKLIEDLLLRDGMIAMRKTVYEKFLYNNRFILFFELGRLAYV